MLNELRDGLRRLVRGVSMALLSLLAASACASPERPDYSASPQFHDGRFRNPVPIPERPLGEQLGIFWRQAFEKPEGTAPTDETPVRTLTRAELDGAPDGSLWRLGHASVLFKLRGRYLLTDPMFSERASPLSWAGPKRFHKSPIAIDALPPIAAVIVSHDHYDHLDHASVLALAAGKAELFVTPLGVGDRLVEWGVPAARVRQLDWWQSVDVEGLRLVAVPAQHFSGRTLSDRNRTLWASWVLLDGDGGRRIFFSGDTGYHAGLETIGERYGPFDATLLECGAYDRQWPLVHLQPEEAMQAHHDLRGRLLVPIHNGSFDLGMHPWREPIERIAALARAQGVSTAMPMFGERVTVGGPAVAAAGKRR